MATAGVSMAMMIATASLPSIGSLLRDRQLWWVTDRGWQGAWRWCWSRSSGRCWRLLGRSGSRGSPRSCAGPLGGRLPSCPRRRSRDSRRSRCGCGWSVNDRDSTELSHLVPKGRDVGGVLGLKVGNGLLVLRCLPLHPNSSRLLFPDEIPEGRHDHYQRDEEHRTCLDEPLLPKVLGEQPWV